MAKFDVTPELAETIKTIRLQNRVTAKAVAEHIGKSQPYLSKLERGDIKTIDESVLTSIFQFIFGENEGFQEFLERILDTLEMRFTDQEIKEQLWFDNYDTVLRQIPIPEELADDFCMRLNELGLSVDDLCRRINANEGISPQVTNKDKYPFNEWQAFVRDHKVLFYFIKMRLTPDDIERILSKESKTANYVTVLSIAHYLSRIKRYGAQIDIPEEVDAQIMLETRDYLNKFKFFSIYEKSKIKKQATTQAELDALITSFDQSNMELINKVISAFRLFSEMDIIRTNKYLEQFVKNLKWDNGFMMSLIGLDFSATKDLSYAVKKDMLMGIQDIVKKYEELPTEQKTIEIYD